MNIIEFFFFSLLDFTSQGLQVLCSLCYYKLLFLFFLKLLFLLYVLLLDSYLLIEMIFLQLLVMSLQLMFEKSLILASRQQLSLTLFNKFLDIFFILLKIAILFHLLS